MGEKESIQVYIIALMEIVFNNCIDNFSSWVVSVLTIVFMFFKAQKMYHEKRLAKINVAILEDQQVVQNEELENNQ